MKKIFNIITIISFLGIILAIGCTKTPEVKNETPSPQKQEQKIPMLTALKTEKAPEIDGKSEEEWNNTEALTVEMINGGKLGPGGKFNNGNSTAKIKALYDNENIYIQLQWEDPTESLARGPWQKEGDKLVKKSYDEYYEDKLAVNWNIKNSVKGFGTDGCFVTCHPTKFKNDKGVTIIKHYTNADNEILDMWHWKLTRQNTLFGPDKPGLMHDQYMDNVEFDPEDSKKKGAGRHADPGEKEYEDNTTGEKPDYGEPKLVFDGEALNGNPYIIVEGVDKTKPYAKEYLQQMKDGDFIPGAIAKQITGDPADINAKGKYENGKWTLEIKRKLTTESDKDIQFDDLKKEYEFAVAAFDNSQIGHAYQKGVNKLVFK